MITVRQMMNKYDPLNHGIHFAIHQSIDECIASFYMAEQFDTKDVEFKNWNSYVTNRTSYKTPTELLSATVTGTKEVSPDWIVLYIDKNKKAENPEKVEQLRLFDNLL